MKFKYNRKFDYIYNLKAISVIAVILIHSIGPYFYLFNKISNLSWTTVSFIDSFIRFCVPIFLMCSGATILCKDYKIKNWIVEKIIYRLTVPFVIYSVILAFIDYHNIHSIINNLKLVRYYLPFYTIILSLYLIYPILRSWIKSAKNENIIYFLMIWILIIFIQFFYPTFPYISSQLLYSYIGYPIIGYLLIKIDTKKYKFFGLFVYVLSSILIFLITIFLTKHSNEPVEKYFDYTSPFVIFMTVGLFIYFKNIEFKLNKYISYLRKFLSDNSWGFYLLHPIILYIVTPYFLGYKIYISIILRFVFTIITTSLILFVAKKNPLIKNVCC